MAGAKAVAVPDDAKQNPPRPTSLTKAADFRRLRHGWRQSGNHLLIQLLPKDSMADNPVFCQFGLIVTRKMGKAVVRNRIKRRLRAAIQTLWQTQPQLLQNPTWQASLVARKSCLDAPFLELVTELSTAVRRWQRWQLRQEGDRASDKTGEHGVGLPPKILTECP